MDGSYIYQLCKDCGQSLADAARNCGVPDLEAIADGERQATGREMVQIARYFETTVQALDLAGDIPESQHDEPIIVPKERWGSIEVCQFCDACYHPMMRWSRGNTVITVCSPEHHKLMNQNDTGCERIAGDFGFKRRPDLTPRR
jgi:hypothetical protein